MADIPFAQIDRNRQLALVRLQLAYTGYTHAWLLAYSDKAGAILRRNEGDTLTVLQQLETAWDQAFATWLKAFENARRQAAMMAFGELQVMHNHFMGVKGIAEAGPSPFPPVFERQLQEVLDAAANRIHGDGFKLSQRIWRLDTESFAGIRSTVMGGIADQKSAWQLAQEVEQYLAPLANCPRWARSRLFLLTKADIAAGDETGLLRGAACSPETGVAYNALRLARTEISFAHNGATETIHRRSPWVEAVKVNLNPQHPGPDICDEKATGGEGGKGVYPVGDVEYPPYHPHCLCFTTAVTMPDEAFYSKMRGWLNGTQVWPAMDSYAAGIGRTRFNVTGIMTGLDTALAKWLFTEEFDPDEYEQGRLFEGVAYEPTIERNCF